MRGLASGARARFRRGPAIVSTLGWIVLGAGALLLAAGLVLQWIELIVLGLTALAAMAVAVPFTLGRSAYDVSLELQPRRVRVGDRAHGRVEVRAMGDRRSVPTRLEVPIGADQAEFGVPALEPGERHDTLIAVPTSRRAIVPAGPVRSVRGDALGLLRRTVRWTERIELFIHPRTVALESSAAGVVRDLEGIASTRLTDHDLAFHALRPYESGDDRRNIHWRTSARTGVLMVRQFEETRRSRLTVVLVLDAEQYASDDEFELAVSIFASIVQQLLRDGIEVDAVTERGRVPTGSLVAMLDACSGLERTEPSRSPARESQRERVARVTRRLAPPTVVALIGGSALEAPDVQRTRGLFARDVAVAAFRAELGAAAGVRTVGDAGIATLGELGELPRLLRSRGLA